MDIQKFDELLQETKQRQMMLLRDDSTITWLQNMGELKEEYKDAGDGIKVDSEKFLIFGQHYPMGIFGDVIPPLDTLLDFLSLLPRILKAIERYAPPEVKACQKILIFFFLYQMCDVAGWTIGTSENQKKYREDFFNRRNELPKNNIFRKIFVEGYIDKEVFGRFSQEICSRFYLEKEKETGQSNAGGLAYAPTYTPEGAKDWDERFNRLCDEYGEAQYKRIYDDPKNYYSHITVDDRLSRKAWLQLAGEMVAEEDKMLTDLERNLITVSHYIEANKNIAKEIISSKDLTTFIEIINIVGKILKDLKAPEGKKACLVWWLRDQIWLFMDFGEPSLSAELFNRRDEITGDNVLRNYIVFYYVQNEVFKRFYNTEDDGFEDDDCDSKSSEEVERSIKEYEEKSKMLYLEYNEKQMLSWSIEEEDCQCRRSLPESTKKALAMGEEERQRKFMKAAEIFHKVAEFKAGEGIVVDEKAFALLTEEEKGLLEEVRHPFRRS